MEPLWQYVASIDWQSWLDRLPDQVWSIWTVGGLLLLVGGLIAWRGLLQDRSRGRPRCPRCWYDMRSLPEPRCPECGFAATSAAGLLRTRRYWRQAAVGGAVGMLGGCVFANAVRVNGWASLLPTSILISLATRANYWNDPPTAELRRRQADRHLSAAQWRSLLSPEAYLIHRPKWVRNVPIHLRTKPYSWMDSVYLVIRPVQTETQDPVAHEGQVSFSLWERFSDFVAEGSIPGQFEFVVQADMVGTTPPPHEIELWRRVVSLPIEFHDRIEEVMEPVRDPRVDDQVRRLLWPLITVNRPRSGEEPFAVLNLGRYGRPSPFSGDTAFRVRAEIAFPGTRAMPIPLERRGFFPSDDRPNDCQGVRFESRAVDVGQLSEYGHWVLRITPDVPETLAELSKTRFWDGKIEYSPHEVVVRAGTSRDRWRWLIETPPAIEP